jgi:prostaglandin reductase 1
LNKAAPNGVDCFFDNVGGQDSSVVLSKMNRFGRVSVCGAISAYNAQNQPEKATIVQPAMVFNELKMEGFIVSRWFPRWSEGINQMAAWINQGKIVARETRVKGFEKAPQALVGLFEGENTGKMLVAA